MSWYSIAGNEIRIVGRFDDLGAFANDLAAVPAGPVTVTLNSGGGDVCAADTVATLLKNRDVKVIVEGVAASAALVVLLVARTVSIRANALIQLHAPTYTVTGPASAMREAAERLDGLTRLWAERLAARCRMLPAEIALALIARGTTMTASEAVLLGLADEMIEPGPTPPMWALDEIAGRLERVRGAKP